MSTHRLRQHCLPVSQTQAPQCGTLKLRACQPPCALTNQVAPSDPATSSTSTTSSHHHQIPFRHNLHTQHNSNPPTPQTSHKTLATLRPTPHVSLTAAAPKSQRPHPMLCIIFVTASTSCVPRRPQDCCCLQHHPLHALPCEASSQSKNSQVMVWLTPPAVAGAAALGPAAWDAAACCCCCCPRHPGGRWSARHVVRAAR